MTSSRARARPPAAAAPGPVPDWTDRVIHQWATVRPDLDVSSVGIIGMRCHTRYMAARPGEATALADRL